MSDSSYDVDAGSGSGPNRPRPQNNRVVANIDVTGDPVNVEASGGDTTPALTGGTASKKGGKSFGKRSALAGAAMSKAIVPKAGGSLTARGKSARP